MSALEKKTEFHLLGGSERPDSGKRDIIVLMIDIEYYVQSRGIDLVLFIYIRIFYASIKCNVCCMYI